MDNLTYDEIINRIGFFRNKAKLSMRETSSRLGMNPQFIKTIENKTVELKVKTLLDFCEVVDIDIFDFFYIGNEYNKEYKILLDLFNELSKENKQFAIDFIKNICLKRNKS